MTNPLKKASLSSFIWITLLLLILAYFVVVTLAKDSKSRVLRSNIAALKSESENYQKLDSCVSILYDAENNSRLFVTTLDSSYLHSYKTQIAAVARMLSDYESSHHRQGLPLSSLIVDKKLKDEQFVEMKMLVDSLLIFSFQLKSATPIAVNKPIPVVTKTQKIAKTDSVYIEPQKNKKRLFRRIADAISNKSSEERALAKSESTITIKDSTLVSEKTSGKTAMDIFQQYENARRQLNDTERQMLFINSRLFANLKNILAGMKAEEGANLRVIRNELVATSHDQLDEVDRLFSGNIVIVLVLTMVIIWNLIRLYKQENSLLKYAQLTTATTRKKGEFMAQIAHEIRTPLNAIIGFSQLIDSDKLDDEIKPNINAIKSSSRTLLVLVNEILDFSKFESGKIALVNTPFLPAEILSDTESMLSVLAQEKNITIHSHLNLANDLRLIGDGFRLKQVVINLLSNAIKFTPDHGHITLAGTFDVKEEGGGVLRIGIRDSGVGIAKENLDKIFDDFVQVENAETTSRQAGTGLGLAICKRIVDLCGGKISVKSEPGTGSEFTVEIPLLIAPPAKRANIEKSPELPGTGFLNGKRILIADDVKMNLVLIGMILDKHGVVYDLVKDGDEAFEHIVANAYDLVITDIHMPKSNGFELTARIRQMEDELKSTTPILCFTGSSSNESQHQYIKAGMNGVIRKPFEEAKLISTIEELVRV
ncbi:MAG TPA: ATP-binding protein [Dyadobacter sp.]|jgi:signal transduction histidine kinase|nr:ATP-binding protein [Dyadobacter sp.]